MAINFSEQVYSPTFNVFARTVMITPTVSQPTVASYIARGIYSTQPVDVLAEDTSVFSDQRTILDIIEEEFSVVPVQGDIVDIPDDVGVRAKGTFEIVDVVSNGVETSLALRKIVPAKP